MYQILSVVHCVYVSFDCSPPLDVREIFLDMPSFLAFYKVWHGGIIYKIKCFHIERISMKQFQNFIENRLQKVLLN